jgi:NAD(P)-dependent dehydrogenase (short-subunit alcohol dehydrogenase family)
MDTALKGKTVLITGASRNMGRLAAIAFAREGANLAICTSAKMQQLKRGGRGMPCVRRKGRCRALRRGGCGISERLRRLKCSVSLAPVHIALNNAVSRVAEGGFLNVSDEAWGDQFSRESRRSA